MSQKDWLKLHIQEHTNNNGLDDDIIDKLAKLKFDYPNYLQDIRHFVFACAINSHSLIPDAKKTYKKGSDNVLLLEGATNNTPQILLTT